MEAVNSQLSEAQKIAGGSGSEQDIAEAKIEIEVRRMAVQSRQSTNFKTGSRESAGRTEVDLKYSIV